MFEAARHPRRFHLLHDPPGLRSGRTARHHRPEHGHPLRGTRQLLGLGGFELTGAERRFVPATAALDDNHITVTAPGVPKPVALRYAFLYHPECTLYNSAGLSALPFRSDDWPVRPAGSIGAHERTRP